MYSDESLSYTEFLREEIALEGHHGISLEGLWTRLAANKKFTSYSTLDEHLKKYLWTLLLRMDDLSTFIIPISQAVNQPKNHQIHFSEGVIIEQKISHQSHRWNSKASHGKIEKISVKGCSYEEIRNKYGNCLILVASISLRRKAMGIQHLDVNLIDWNSYHGVMLETIARSRCNGCLSYGKNSLEDVVSSKGLRSSGLRKLEKMKLVRKQTHPFMQLNGTKRYVHLYFLERFYVKPSRKKDLIIDTISDLMESSRKDFCPVLEIEALKKETPKYRRRFFLSKLFKEQFQIIRKSEPPGALQRGSSPKKKQKMVQYIVKLNSSTDQCIQNTYLEEPSHHNDDESFARRIFSYVHGFGSTGVSIDSLKKHMKLSRSSITNYVNLLLNRGLFFTVVVEEGRISSIRYVDKAFFDVCPNVLGNIKHQEKIKSLKRKINKSEELILENPRKKTKRTSTRVNKLPLSSRALARQGLVLEKISQCRLVESSVLYRELVLLESETEVVMDSRSFNSLLDRLEKEKLLRRWHLPHYSVTLVSDAAMTEDDELYKSFTEVLDSHARVLSMLPSESCAPLVPDTGKCTAGKKFNKLREMHYLLQYLTRHHTKENETLISGAEGRISLPAIPKYHRIRDPGWVLVADLIPRIPLRTYASLVNISETSLYQYFLDKEQQYTPIGELPETAKKELMDYLKFFGHLSVVLDRLALMGLVQYGPFLFDRKEFTTLFVNKKALLVVENEGALVEELFEFEDMASVHQYWLRLENLCWSSSLKFISEDSSEDQQSFDPKDISTVLEGDVGYLLGDRKGPGGLDSSLNAQVRLNWDNTYSGPSFEHVDWEERRKVTEPTIPKNSKYSGFPNLKTKKRNSTKEKQIATKPVWSLEEDAVLVATMAGLSYQFPNTTVSFPKELVAKFLEKTAPSVPRKTARSVLLRYRRIKKLFTTKDRLRALQEYLGPAKSSKLPKRITVLSVQQKNDLWQLMQRLCGIARKIMSQTSDQNGCIEKINHIDKHVIRSLIYSGLCSLHFEETKPYQLHLASQTYPMPLFESVIDELLEDKVIIAPNSFNSKKYPCEVLRSKYHLSNHSLLLLKDQNIPFDVLSQGWDFLYNMMNSSQISLGLQLFHLKPNPLRNTCRSLQFYDSHYFHHHVSYQWENSEQICSQVVCEMAMLRNISSTWKARNITMDEPTEFDEDEEGCTNINVCLHSHHRKMEKYLEEAGALNETALSKVSRMIPALPTTSYVLTTEMRDVLAKVESLGELGATTQDLKDFSTSSVMDAIKELEKRTLIWRVGADVPRWVSYQYITRWTVRLPSTPESTGVHVIPKPWVRVDSTINRRVLNRSLSSIFFHVFDNPGIIFANICDKFSPSLTPVWILEILEILVHVKCILPFYLDTSDPDNPTVVTVTWQDCYDNKIFYEASCDGISRLATFIAKKKPEMPL